LLLLVSIMIMVAGV